MKNAYLHTFKKLFAEINPKFIGELGTHNGESAVQFCNLALNLSNQPITYHGYDVFELVKDNKEFARKERNAKGNGFVDVADRKLKSLKRAYKDRFDYKLFKGYTTDTLNETAFDFVYIDAGHSYDSVVHDWNKVKNSKLIVFDDIKLKSVLNAIIDHVQPTHHVEYTTRSQTTRGLAIVRNY